MKKVKRTASGHRTPQGGVLKPKKGRRPGIGGELEPVQLSREEILDQLATFHDRKELAREKLADAATIDALIALGFRIVKSCELCAEPQPDLGRIPACPNVATVTADATRHSGIFMGKTHVCAPHARGEKVWAPRDGR